MHSRLQDCVCHFPILIPTPPTHPNDANHRKILSTGITITAFLGLVSVSNALDACPFVNGTSVKIEQELAWNVIDLIMTPNTKVKGPNQQAVFRLQPLFQALNQSTNCLVCYNYGFANITTVTRLMCADGRDAYLAQHEDQPNEMRVFMTKVDLPTGYSADYGCEIGLFQHVVLESLEESTLQCWLRPLPQESEAGQLEQEEEKAEQQIDGQVVTKENEESSEVVPSPSAPSAAGSSASSSSAGSPSSASSPSAPEDIAVPSTVSPSSEPISSSSVQPEA